MKGRGHAIAAVLAFALLAPAAQAQNGSCLPEEVTLSPSEFRGFFEGPLGGGTTATGITGFTGWVMAVSGVRSVQMLVDDVAAMDAVYGQHRPGISDLFPGFPGGDNIGFGALLDTTRFTNGDHVVNVLVTTNDGRHTLLGGRTITFTNSIHLLGPFGDLQSPPENANLIGRCDVNFPQRHYTAFVGFALDSGVEIGHRGVGWVEILVDGVIYRNSRRDCTLNVAAGGLSDCYGLTLNSTTSLYPSLSDTPNSGFRFILDVGELITDYGLTRGPHDVVIRAGDVSGQQRNIDEITVNFNCVEDFTNFDSIGDIEVGNGPAIIGGTVSIEGWALDFKGVHRVQVLIDGSYRGNAVYGMPRPGVTLLYPSFPDSLAPGWAYLLDSTQLTNGPHTVGIIVVDNDGRPTFIGERHFLVGNLVQ